MNKKEKDDLFASRIPGILNYHQIMLMDGVRNKFLFDAIKKHISAETAFLDVGAGTGVWAVLAAKLGAKRVVAIEIEESLIPIIFKLAQENGVANKIEIIHGNSNDVRIRGKFDVIVSEIFGGKAYGKEIINSFVNLRKRFLAPNGVLIPQKLVMLAAPVYVDNFDQGFPANLPISFKFFKTLKLNYSHIFLSRDKQSINFLAEPQKLLEVDFRYIEKPIALNNLTAVWKINDLRKANAIATFTSSIFSDELEMNSLDSSTWGTEIYEFQSLNQTEGEILFKLNIEAGSEMWSISLLNSDVKPQSYSPAFAPPRIKVAQQMTPYRKAIPPKSAKN